MFGDYSVLTERAINYTAVTAMPSELVLVETKEIMNIQSELRFKLKEVAKTHPSDEYFRKLYYKNTLWSSYKKNLVDNIIAEKQIKRNRAPGGRSYTPVKSKNPISFCHKEKGLYREKMTGYTRLPPLYNMYCMVDSKMNNLYEHNEDRIASFGAVRRQSQGK